MADEMVERVARAVWECRAMHVGVVRLLNAGLPAWEDETQELRDDVRAEVRAAIAAMREPTKAMFMAGSQAEPSSGRRITSAERACVAAAVTHRTRLA